MSNSDPSLFAERLRAAREFRGLTQAALAEKCGQLVSAIAHFEGGRRRPSLDSFASLIDALDVDPDFLLGRSESPVATSLGSDNLNRVVGRLPAADRRILEVLARELAKRGER